MSFFPFGGDPFEEKKQEMIITNNKNAFNEQRKEKIKGKKLFSIFMDLLWCSANKFCLFFESVSFFCYENAQFNNVFNINLLNTT